MIPCTARDIFLSGGKQFEQATGKPLLSAIHNLAKAGDLCSNIFSFCSNCAAAFWGKPDNVLS